MSQPKWSKAIALTPAISLPALDVKTWAVRIALALFCLTGPLALEASRIEATKLRYEITSLYQARTSAQAEIRRLETEISHTVRPQRIQAVAQQIGMVTPQAHQVISMDE